MSSTTLPDIRRENLRKLMTETDGPTALAKRLGYTNGSFLVQMAGPNPMRQVTEKTARRFEKTLRLPSGWFDEPRGNPTLAKPAKTAPAGHTPAPTSPAGAMSAQQVADVIRLVGVVLDAEQVQLPPIRFADIVALAWEDTVEHSGTARPEYVRQLVKLVK